MRVRDAVRKVRNREFPATIMLSGEAEYIRSVAVQELIAAADVAVPDRCRWNSTIRDWSNSGKTIM